MRTVLFIMAGVAVVWLLPGAISAAVCLASRRLRKQAIQLSRHSLAVSVRETARRFRITEDEARRRFRVPDSDAAHVVSSAIVLTLSGPLAIGRVRSLGHIEIGSRRE